MKVLEPIQDILEFTVGKLSIGNIIFAIIVFLICQIVIKGLVIPIEGILNRLGFDNTLKGFLRTVIKVLLNFVALCIVAESVGIPIASLLAVLGMLGLAVSLSVQGALSNLANGIMLLVARPFKSGDYVMVGSGVEGTVVEITLLCTKIVTIDNKDVFVPNTEIASNKITNFSSEKYRRVDLNFNCGYDVPVETAKKALKEAIDSLPYTQHEPAEPFINIMSFKDYTLEYVVRVWVKSENYWDGYFGLLEAAKKSFENNGINAAIPHMNVHMKEQ